MIWTPTDTALFIGAGLVAALVVMIGKGVAVFMRGKGR